MSPFYLYKQYITIHIFPIQQNHSISSIKICISPVLDKLESPIRDVNKNLPVLSYVFIIHCMNYSLLMDRFYPNTSIQVAVSNVLKYLISCYWWETLTRFFPMILKAACLHIKANFLENVFRSKILTKSWFTHCKCHL
jgi:hypothetical protein